MTRPNYRFFAIYALIIFMVLLHLPFIFSDPNVPFDESAGAYTDEGLYLFQSKNWLNGHGLVITESDGWLKTPMYNLLLTPFLIFNNLAILRLLSLLFLVFSALSLLKSLEIKNPTMLALGILLSMQTSIFFHAHFAMAENFVIGFFLLAIRQMFFAIDKWKPLAILLIFIAAFCKIQYVYLVFFIPLFIVLLLRKQQINKLWWFAYYGFCIVASIFIYKNIALYEYILNDQVAGKMQTDGYWLQRAKWNLLHLIQARFTLFFILIFVLTAVMSLIKAIVKKQKIGIAYGLLLSVFLFELHKLFYIYLPQRYLVFWFILMLVLSLIQVNYLLKNVLIPQKIQIFSLLIIALVFLFQYANNLKYNNFEMQSASNTFKKHLQQQDVIVGAWAPSIFFNASLATHTAWNGYFENVHIWKRNGTYILMDENQSAINELYFNKLPPNLMLKKIATSKVKNWQLALWKVVKKDALKE